MNEMIERVARALFLDRFPDSEDYWPDRVNVCELGSADDYRGYARTAIEAMREPTLEMKTAMEPWTRVSGHQEGAWKAGIDAALK